MVYLVGAGPGDIGLITLKGLECIKNADVIIYDHLVNPTFINYAKENCSLIYAGKIAGTHHMEQEKINEILIKYGKTQNTVRLKGGDPFIFGRGGEEADALSQNNIPYEIVAGVSSCHSAPLYSGIPVTHRGTAPAFHVITGHEKNENETINYNALAKLTGTLVFMMGLNAADNISAKLIENGMNESTPTAIISNGTTQKHSLITGTLTELPDMAKKMSAPAVILVGDTVKLQNNWFYSSGKNILATGTHAVNKQLQKNAKGTLTEISLIKTIAMNYEIFEKTDLQKFSHIVFTSANGVNIFFEYLKRAKKDIRTLNAELAAVGRKTALALEEKGVFADIIPDTYKGSELANILCGRAHTEMLIIRAENGGNEMTDILKKHNVRFTDLKLYKTETDYSKKELLNLCAGEMDYIIIASGSAAKAFSQMARCPVRAKFISIGRETTAIAEKYDIEIYKTAKEPTAESIIECIRRDFE